MCEWSVIVLYVYIYSTQLSSYCMERLDQLTQTTQKQNPVNLISIWLLSSTKSLYN